VPREQNNVVGLLAKENLVVDDGDMLARKVVPELERRGLLGDVGHEVFRDAREVEQRARTARTRVADEALATRRRAERKLKQVILRAIRTLAESLVDLRPVEAERLLFGE
jgi:hypothetical protein